MGWLLPEVLCVVFRTFYRAFCSAAGQLPQPHGDAGAEDALNQTGVKVPQDGPPQASSPQLSEEVETLVGLPDRTGSAGTPGVVVAMCTSRCL